MIVLHQYIIAVAKFVTISSLPNLWATILCVYHYRSSEICCSSQACRNWTSFRLFRSDSEDRAALWGYSLPTGIWLMQTGFRLSLYNYYMKISSQDVLNGKFWLNFLKTFCSSSHHFHILPCQSGFLKRSK